MIEINNTTRSNINLALVKKIIKKFLEFYQKMNYSISIAFVGDKKMRLINKQCRNEDKITDILSFQGEDKFLGELILNYAQIKRQALINQKSKVPSFVAELLQRTDKSQKLFDYELVFVLIHGLLHLVGYEDNTAEDERKIIKLGEKFIKTFKHISIKQLQ